MKIANVEASEGSGSFCLFPQNSRDEAIVNALIEGGAAERVYALGSGNVGLKSTNPNAREGARISVSCEVQKKRPGRLAKKKAPAETLDD